MILIGFLPCLCRLALRAGLGGDPAELVQFLGDDQQQLARDLRLVISIFPILHGESGENHQMYLIYNEGNPKTSPEDRLPLCSSALQPFHPSQLWACALYSTVDESSDELELGPTKEKN